ncbi:uncharacterized protein LOC127282257 [Leptopilina boulardi]|uniref:uncharacterized protein LOC127282257 n=1 Tax=Leptopilina boulardi TaxID=63433 RepID=UPI0021F56756|nr:uncharacterized protein LOC127282257 [Leptopilina boulardi]
MEEILSIPASVNFDESIANYEIHSHQPYASSSFNNSDEIRIIVQNQDLSILPSNSVLHIFGRLTNADGTDATQNIHFTNNAIAYLFDEIRYELNGIEIDRCKYVGHTTTMKSLVSLTPPQLNRAENAGVLNVELNTRMALQDGYFDISIPLGMIFGFAEDYKKIVMNAKHELILIRARSDLNSIIQMGEGADEQFKVQINKVEWLVPYVLPSDNNKIKLLKFIEKDPLISMSFRSWEMFEYPLIPSSTRVMWQIKSSTQLEKPRYVIVGFQTGRKDKRKKSASYFDHCDITNMEFIVDVQGFKKPCNDFIFKELAILPLEADAQPRVYLFEPPCAWNSLPERYKSENLWLTNNYHGIHWMSGDVSYDELRTIIQETLRGAKTIYTKGVEKKQCADAASADAASVDAASADAASAGAAADVGNLGQK